MTNRIRLPILAIPGKETIKVWKEVCKDLLYLNREAILAMRKDLITVVCGPNWN